MRSRIIVGSLALLVSLPIGIGVSRTTADPVLKWAVVNLTETTWIAGVFASGPVVFVHDDAKMAEGKPCTSVHRFDWGKGPGEELVAFHCKPRWGSAPERFTVGVALQPNGPRVLTEYQFAGDKEAHGVPRRAH